MPVSNSDPRGPVAPFLRFLWLLAGLVLAVTLSAGAAMANPAGPQPAAGALPALLTGYGTALSLILAIGAQNAFVLRQGLRREHVFWVCLFCAVSDAVLILLGIFGADRLLSNWPWFGPVMRWGGAVFLIFYGLKSALAAWRGGEALHAGNAAAAGLGATLATVAVLTWANPHVYLDTLVLIGAISTRWEARWAFALGAVAGSGSFFFALGYGARLLAPIFARPLAWRLLDLAVALVMWVIAAVLITGG